MDDIRRTDILTNGHDSKLVNGVNGVNGEVAHIEKKGMMDPRLTLFGYTTETVNMLLVPMFENKYVI